MLNVKPYNLYQYGIKLKNTDLDALGKELGCTFSVRKTRSPHWERIFILDQGGVSIGRITLENGQVYSLKHYKPRDIETLSQEDKIYCRLESVLTTGSILPSDLYNQFTTEAKNLADKDLEEKKAWRTANPPGKNKRKGLKRRSERWLVISMVRDWCNQQIQEEQAQEAEDDWHQQINNMYTYTEDGFCDGFTKY